MIWEIHLQTRICVVNSQLKIVFFLQSIQCFHDAPKRPGSISRAMLAFSDDKQLNFIIARINYYWTDLNGLE